MRTPNARIEIELQNLRRKTGGSRVTRGVVDQLTDRVQESLLQSMEDLDLEADTSTVENRYGYEIARSSSRAARRRSKAV